jgi:hypothetical protein
MMGSMRGSPDGWWIDVALFMSLWSCGGVGGANDKAQSSGICVGRQMPLMPVGAGKPMACDAGLDSVSSRRDLGPSVACANRGPKADPESRPNVHGSAPPREMKPLFHRKLTA